MTSGQEFSQQDIVDTRYRQAITAAGMGAGGDRRGRWFGPNTSCSMESISFRNDASQHRSQGGLQPHSSTLPHFRHYAGWIGLARSVGHSSLVSVVVYCATEIPAPRDALHSTILNGGFWVSRNRKALSNKISSKDCYCHGRVNLSPQNSRILTVIGVVEPPYASSDSFPLVLIEMDERRLNRFDRHIVLDQIGLLARLSLKVDRDSNGAGGLGPALLYLAAAGIGEIRIIDDDVVDVSNLQRQVLHR